VTLELIYSRTHILKLSNAGQQSIISEQTRLSFMQFLTRLFARLHWKWIQASSNHKYLSHK